MYPSSNIVCYLHYPCCLSSLLSNLPLWVPQDLVSCHSEIQEHVGTRGATFIGWSRKFSHCTKSSCSCFVHQTPVTWLGPVHTYSLSLPRLEHNITIHCHLFFPHAYNILCYLVSPFLLRNALSISPTDLATSGHNFKTTTAPSSPPH
jgi:hypothetical protein